MKESSAKIGALIVSWVMQLIMVAILGAAAYQKLTGAVLSVEMFRTLEMEPGGRYIIGVLEVVACALLLLPNVSIHGAILSLGLMVGALIAHFSVIGFYGITPVMAFVVVVCSILVIVLRRKQFACIDRMVS